MDIAQIKSLLVTDPNHPSLFLPTRDVKSEEDWDVVSRHWPAMIEFLRDGKNGGCALAANQLALPLSFFVIVIPSLPELVVVNPRVEGIGKQLTRLEWCLSGRGETRKRKRHTDVHLWAQDQKRREYHINTTKGYYRRVPTKGMLFAQACQHEYEHLQGIDTRTGEKFNPDLWDLR